jgi:hypothetical protein
MAALKVACLVDK